MRALVRPYPRALDVHRNPHAYVFARRPRTKHLDRPFEQSRIVPAVIDHLVAVLPCNPKLVRKLVGLDEVAPPHLDAIEPQIRGDRIKRSLHHETRVRTSRASIRRCWGGVRVDVAESNAVVRHAVWPR